MFLLRMIQYLLGTVRLRAEGGSPEKFLNLVAQRDISLWDIRLKDGMLTAGALSRSLKRLRPLAGQAGVVLSVEARKGLPHLAKRFAGRTGLLIGTVLFLALVWFFSSFIWEIDITGNKTVPTAQIEQELASLGLRPGAFSTLLQVRAIQSGLLLRLPDLSGVTINLHGSTAYVEVRERLYPPEIVPEGQPCNIKASMDGQILQLEAYDGKPMVKNGDAVIAGQLLISGVVPDKDGAVRILHAQGAALARTNRELTVTMPYLSTENRETGRVVKRHTLEVFGFGIPLYFGALQGNYNRFSYLQPLTLFGLRLPVALNTRLYREWKPTQVRYTPQQAAEKAKDALAEKEKTELSNIKIVSKSVETKTDASGCTLVGHYVCEENIAVAEAIQIS